MNSPVDNDIKLKEVYANSVKCDSGMLGNRSISLVEELDLEIASLIQRLSKTQEKRERDAIEQS